MLVRPFIQPIPAFNATEGGVATISILGGDAITVVNYEIFYNRWLMYSNTLSVMDNGGDSIRNFNIPLTANMGIGNNQSYTIRVYTQNATETSGYSSVQYFSCYVTPIITLKDSENNTIGDNYEFDSQSGEITILFDKVSNASSATLNDIEINIYGVKGTNRDLVYSSGMVYTPYKVEFDNLLPTTIENPLYDSYSLEWVAHTVQKMVLNDSYSNITCDYTIIESTGLISAENDASNGRIKITFKARRFGSLLSAPAPSGNWDILTSVINKKNVFFAGQGGSFSSYNIETQTFGSRVQAPSIIYSICADEEHVYAGGARKFAIYDIETQTFGEAITNPFSRDIRALATDGINVYVGGLGGEFAIYNIETQMFGNLISTQFTNIFSIVYQNAKLYIGGSFGQFAIYDIDTQTFTSLITTPFNGNIVSLATDSNNIYTATKQNQFAIYNIETQSFSDSINIPFEQNTLEGITTDGIYVYFCGMYGQFVAYSIEKQRFCSAIETPFGQKTIYSVATDGRRVYAMGGYESFAVYKLNKTTIKRKEANAQNERFSLIELDGDENLLSEKYFFYDYYAKTDMLYEYQITSDETIESVQILSQFCGAYIADGTTGYEISEDWQIPDSNQNQKSVIYEPYGRKYPVVAYNALTNYSSGSDMAILRSESNRQNNTNNYIDRISQTKILKQFNSFLTNRRAKVRKDFNGNIAIVSILNSVPSSFIQELGNGIAKTQFSWVEIGDFTDEDFKKLGIANSFKLYED